VVGVVPVLRSGLLSGLLSGAGVSRPRSASSFCPFAAGLRRGAGSVGPAVPVPVRASARPPSGRPSRATVTPAVARTTAAARAASRTRPRRPETPAVCGTVTAVPGTGRPGGGGGRCAGPAGGGTAGTSSRVAVRGGGGGAAGPAGGAAGAGAPP